MILTGKAKEDFGDVCKYDYHEFINLDEVIQYALIIEWFDSVGIFIDSLHSYSFDNTLEYCVKVNNTYISHGIKNKPINRFDSRKEATKQAILKANEIYNARH